MITNTNEDCGSSDMVSVRRSLPLLKPLDLLSRMGLCLANTSLMHWGSPWGLLCCDHVCQAKMALIPSNEKLAVVVQLCSSVGSVIPWIKSRSVILDLAYYMYKVSSKNKCYESVFFNLQYFFYFVFSKTKQKPQKIQMEGKQPFYASELRTWWIFFFLRQIPLLSQFWQVQLEFCYISALMQHLLTRKVAFFLIRCIVRIILKKQLSVLF